MSVPDENRHGISAIVMAHQAALSALLDLAAVLQGLVSANFEILVVGEPSQQLGDVLAGLRATAPGLPVRRVDGTSVSDGCAAAGYDLLFVSVPEGQFDVRALNHLLDAVDGGADVAIAYRPHWNDGIVHTLQRLGWQVDVDCAFGLFRRSICRDLRRYATSSALLWRVRHMGLRTMEVPLMQRRPTIGTAAPAEPRAA